MGRLPREGIGFSDLARGSGGNLPDILRYNCLNRAQLGLSSGCLSRISSLKILTQRRQEAKTQRSQFSPLQCYPSKSLILATFFCARAKPRSPEFFRSPSCIHQFFVSFVAFCRICVHLRPSVVALVAAVPRCVFALHQSFL